MHLQAINNALIFAWVALELFLSLYKRSKSKGQQDHSSLRIIWVTLIIAILAANWVADHHRIMPFSNQVLTQSIALICFITGFVIRYHSIYTLKQFFTFDVHVGAEHELITQGLYRKIRHPAYLGSLLIITALALQFGNLLSFLIVLILAIAVHVYRIRIEEAALMQHFGQKYMTYKKGTWRLVPWIY